MREKGPDMPHDDGFDAELLDLHLGRLPAERRAALEARLAGDPMLASQDDALRTMFAALTRAMPADVPADLAQRASARVAASGEPLRVRRAAARDNEPRIIRMHNFRDIIAVAAMIVLAVGVGVPSLLHLRERDRRIVCAQNLAQIGRGVQQYAALYGDSLPFVGFNNYASWSPSSEPGVVNVPNRRHIFTIVAGRLVDPHAFVCPAAGGVPMTADQLAGRSDFAESRNLSYAYQNMAGVRPSLRGQPDLPIMGDDNPLFEDGLPLFDVRRLGPGSPAESNSRAHGGRGQNVLTLDGRSLWTTTPRSGIGGDNIWTLESVSHYTGREGPQVATDSHLIK